MIYEPDLGGDPPHMDGRDATKALGPPDFVNDGNPYAVSLGNGGRLTLQFTDNLLTGSGDSTPDLWIFEVGADFERTFVEISSDGDVWHDVGVAEGGTYGIDIDAFGFGPLDVFYYVRITDDPEQGDTNPQLKWKGADIDAVGAISHFKHPIPEPATLIVWSLLATLGISFVRWRRKRSALYY